MTKLLIAHCEANADLAQNLAANLPDLQVTQLQERSFTDLGQFAKAATEAQEPVLLVVTDNFMKTEGCMSGALAMTLTLLRQSRLMVVIANGTQLQDGQLISVETHIDRVVYAIQYMNFWQQQYLRLSDDYNHANDDNRSSLFAHQQAVHEIADQTGEFISALRDAEPIHWTTLSAMQHDPVYRFLGVLKTVVPVPPASPDAAGSSLPTDSAVSPPGQEAEPSLPSSATTNSTPLDTAESASHTPTDTPSSAPTTAALPTSGPILFRPAPAVPVGTPLVSPDPRESTSSISSPGDEQAEVVNTTPPVSIPTTSLTSSTPIPETNYRDQEIENTINDAWQWIERGNRELGLEIFRVAAEQYPDHEHLQLEYQKALQNEESATESIENEASAYEAAGNSAYEDGDYLMAKYCWDRAAEANPDTPGIWKKLALLTQEHLPGYTETTAIYLQKAQEQDLETAGLAVTSTLVVDPLESGTQEQDPATAGLAVTSTLVVDPLESGTQEQDPATAGPAVTSTLVVDPLESAPRRREIVLITGATSGIGRATAIEFARQGYRLIITGRRTERLLELQQQLESELDAEVLPLSFDVRDQRAVAGSLENLPEKWQNIDILINNAGLAKGLAPIHEGELHHWETMIDTNIKGLLYVSQIVSRGMVARKKGHIVNLSSSAGKEAYANGNVYCATKFAVEALTKTMRIDLHKYGIRISQVSPGHVEETEFAITRFDGNAEKAKIYDDFQPLTARDVAEAIWFIASRPAHVNVQDVYMFGTQQASATIVDRSGR